MSKQTSPDNEITPDIYESPFTFKLKIILFTSLAFCVALFLMLPLEENIDMLLTRTLKSNRSCSVDYKKTKLSFMLPGITLIKPKISGRCVGPGKTVPLDKISINVTVPSFWPPGVKAHVQVKQQKSVVNIYPKFTFLGHDIRVANTKLTGAFISSFTKFPELISGLIDIDAHFKIEGNKIKSGQFKANSKNLRVPAQNLMGFNLIDLNLKRLQIAGTMKANKINLQAIKIGRENSPLQAEFKGFIGPLKSNINFSKLDLDGKVRLGDDLLDNLSLLKILLQGKKKVGEFYPLKLMGTLAAPKPVFLK